MMIRPFALFTLLALAGCASAPPMVVIHTVPPKFNIVPAKSVAVIGDANTSVDQNMKTFSSISSSANCTITSSTT